MPIYIAAQSEEVTNTRLKTIKKSINYLLTSSCEEKVERTQNEPSGANRPSLEATRKERSPWSNGTATTTLQNHQTLNWTKIIMKTTGLRLSKQCP